MKGWLCEEGIMGVDCGGGVEEMGRWRGWLMGWMMVDGAKR